jgi:hypothetical protein
MTLVIAEDAESVAVLWAALDVRSLEGARQALGRREEINPTNMESFVGVWSSATSSDHGADRSIAEWAGATGVTGVVWTALPPKFAGKPFKPSSDQVVSYLSNLEGETRRLAEEYVRRAPVQIRTSYRRRIEHELGWTAIGER